MNSSSAHTYSVSENVILESLVKSNLHSVATQDLCYKDSSTKWKEEKTKTFHYPYSFLEI